MDTITRHIFFHDKNTGRKRPKTLDGNGTKCGTLIPAYRLSRVCPDLITLPSEFRSGATRVPNVRFYRAHIDSVLTLTIQSV
jgi:hypothetical protein